MAISFNQNLFNKLSEEDKAIIKSIPGIFNKKIGYISSEEVLAIQNYWIQKFDDNEDIDAYTKLNNILTIIKGLDKEYHKRDFEYVLMYLKGEIDDRSLNGGLIESESYFFSFYNFPEFSGSENVSKQKLWLMGYLLSGRLNPRDPIQQTSQIRHIASSQRLMRASAPKISVAEINAISLRCPVIRDFIDSNSIFKISDVQLKILKRLLNSPTNLQILEKQIEEAKQSNPSAYLSDVLSKAINSSLAMSSNNYPNQVFDKGILEELQKNGQITEVVKEFRKQDKANILPVSLLVNLDVCRQNFPEIYSNDLDFKTSLSSNLPFKAFIFRMIKENNDQNGEIFQSLSIKDKIGYHKYLINDVLSVNSTNLSYKKVLEDRVANYMSEIPSELSVLLGLNKFEQNRWKEARASVTESGLTKNIDLDNLDENGQEDVQKLFAQMLPSGEFIMGLVDENFKLKTGLRITKEGKLEIGRFDENNNFILSEKDQENLLNSVKDLDELSKLRIKRKTAVDFSKGIEISTGQIVNPISDFIGNFQQYISPDAKQHSEVLKKGIEDLVKGLGIELSSSNTAFFTLRNVKGKWLCGKLQGEKKEIFVGSIMGKESQIVGAKIKLEKDLVRDLARVDVQGSSDMIRKRLNEGWFSDQRPYFMDFNSYANPNGEVLFSVQPVFNPDIFVPSQRVQQIDQEFENPQIDDQSSVASRPIEFFLGNQTQQESLQQSSYNLEDLDFPEDDQSSVASRPIEFFLDNQAQQESLQQSSYNLQDQDFPEDDRSSVASQPIEFFLDNQTQQESLQQLSYNRPMQIFNNLLPDENNRTGISVEIGYLQHLNRNNSGISSNIESRIGDAKITTCQNYFKPKPIESEPTFSHARSSYHASDSYIYSIPETIGSDEEEVARTSESEKEKRDRKLFYDELKRDFPYKSSDEWSNLSRRRNGNLEEEDLLPSPLISGRFDDNGFKKISCCPLGDVMSKAYKQASKFGGSLVSRIKKTCIASR